MRKPALKNRAAPEIEEVMAALTVEEASFGEMRVDSIRRALSAGCWFIGSQLKEDAALFSGEISEAAMPEAVSLWSALKVCSTPYVPTVSLISSVRSARREFRNRRLSMCWCGA